MVLESNTLDVLFVKDGQQGEDGKILYTWIKYAKDANGTGMTDDPNGAIYIGISYNNESSIESNDPTQYAWTKIQGADGKKGEDAYTIFLENENISFATDKNRNPLSEQAYTSGITIMKGAKPVTDFTIGDIAKTQGIAVAKTDTAIAISVVNGNPLPNDSGEIEIPITVGGTVFKKVLTWTCAKKGEQGEQGERGLQGIQGPQGIQGVAGKDGTNGKTTYFHIKYSSVENPTSSSQLTETPSTYIGTYVDFTETDSTDPKKYTWSQFVGSQGPKGEQGIAGVGVDGKTSYLHIAYANSADGKTGFSASDSTNKSYIGQYTDFTPNDSTDYTKYSWSLIRGKDGTDGVSPTVSVTKNGTTTTITITDKNGTHTQTVKDGTDGTPGQTGKDGKTTYFHVKYSNDGGQTFTSNSGEDVGAYIGTCTDYNQADPTTVGAYTWARIKGEKGDQGVRGEKGKDGTSVTITNKSITYQLSTSGTTIPTGTWQTSPQTIPEGQYQWTKTSVTYSDGNKTESYSISYHSKNGNDGTSVKTTSTSVKYQIGDSGTTKPTGTWQNNVPTVAQGKYLWTQTIVNYSDGNSTESYSVSYRGIDGSNGVNGMNAATIYLYQRATSTPSKPSNTLTYTFSTTKITGTLNNGWSTAIPTGTDAVYITVASVSSKNDTATIAASSWSAPVVLASNGKTGSDGKAGLNVATIYLYQRNTSKPSKPSASVTYTFSTGVASGLNNGWSQKIPDGTNPLYVTLATASSNTATDTILSSEWSDVVVMAQNGEDGQDGISPKVSLSKTGDTTTISIVDATGTHTQSVKDGTNGTPGTDGKDGKTSYFHVKYSNDGGKTFTGNSGEDTGIYMGSYTDYTEADSTDVKKYNWVKVKGDKGDTGQKGQDGTSIKITSKSVTYQTSTSGTTAPTGTWSTTVPTVANGQYLWTKTTVQYSDGNKTEAYSVSYKGTNGTNGTSVTVSKTEVTYQVSTSGTTAPTGTWSTTMPSCDQGQYLWTKTYVKYSDGKDTTSYSVSYKGVDGEKFAFNMLRETNQGSKHWEQHSSGGKYSVEDFITEDNINAVKLICTEAISTSNWSYVSFKDIKMLKQLKPSTKYTLSYDIKANRSGAISHSICKGDASNSCTNTVVVNNIIGNETWQHISVVLTTNDLKTTPTNEILYLGRNALSKVGYSIIKNLKLTEGIVDTPWAPHPEDLEGRGVSETVQYYLATSQASGVTSSTSGWSTDITTQKITADKKYLWNCYQTKYSDGTSEPISTPKIIGVYGDKGTSTKIIRTSYEYNQTNIDKFSTSGYSGVWGVSDATTGLKVGDSVLLRVKNTTKGSDCLIFANITAIPSNYSLTCTSYGVIDNGSDGQDGENAKNLSITPSSQYFKSTDGGKTFAPNTITIKPTIQGEINFGKWQYSIDGGVSFADVVSGQKGLTISNNVLTVGKDSSLYSDVVTMVTFRAVASDSSFYDTCSIAKIYDVTDIGDGRNLWITRDNITLQACEKDKYIYTTTGTSTVCIGADVSSVGTNTIALQTGTKYTISFVISSPSEVGNARWFFCTALNNTGVKNYGGYGVKLVTGENIVSQTITVDVSCDAAGLILYNLPTGCVIKDIQVEKGSSPTGWTPAPEDVQTAILSTKSEISDVSLKVDKNKQAIEQRVEKTTYQQDLNLVKGDISKANEGLNKWRYEIYPKSLFASEYQGKSTMDVFAKNTNLTPSQSVLINDTDLSIAWNYAENYIGYALTFAKFSAAKSVAITFAHDDGAHIYLNGKLIGGSDAYNNNGESLTLGFVKGWNCIEVVVNEGANTEGFKLGTTISVLSECQLMNCYYGTPVARQSHITNQLVQNTTDIDGVSGSVQKVMSTVGGSGKIDEFVNNYSTWKKKIDGIETRVGETYTTKSDFNGLEIGGRNLVKKKQIQDIDSTMLNLDNFLKNGTIEFNVKSTNGGFKFDSYDNYEPNSNYVLSYYFTKTSGTITKFGGFHNGKSNIYTKYTVDGIDYEASVYSTESSTVGTIMNDGNRHRVVVCFTTPSFIKTDDGVNFSYIQPGHGNNNPNFGVKIEELKLEKGNKPTDWTPAPEDVNGKIVNVETIANQTAKKFEWIVKGGDSSSNFTLTDRVADLVAERINFKGLVTFSGATNLIENSNMMNGLANITSECKAIKVIDDSTYRKALVITPIAGGRIFWGVANVWKANITYTVSFVAKSSVAGQKIKPSRSVADWGDEITLTTSYVKYTTRIKSTATADGGTLSFSFSNAIGDVTLTNVKLETGMNPTDWSPAPGDYITQASLVRNWTTNTTWINGGKIYTGSITADKIAANTITADKIATDAIKSRNYISSGGTQGSFLNLSDGSFKSPNLSWDSNGNLIAKNANLSGQITATNGSIGKYKITGQWLITGSGSTATGIGGNQAFWAGAEDSNSAPFRVGYDGKLYANGATISGDITATTGKIGDLTLKDGILTGTGSYSEPYTEDDDGTVTSTITTNYITKLFGKGLTIDSTVKYSDEDDVYSYKVSVLPDEISFTDGEEIGMLGAGGLRILQVNDNSDSYSSEANEVSLSSGASNFYYTTPINQTTDKYLHVCFSADGASFMASQGDKFNSFDIGYSSAKYSGNFAANKFVYTGNSLNYVECLEANDTTNVYFHSSGYYSFRVNNEGNWSNETQSVYITGHGVSVPGQIGLYSQEMSNYVARYYIAGSTKSTAIGNNSYQTRIYGSSVWANKAVSTSDVRLKQDFQSLDKFEDLYMQLQPVSFKYIDGYDKSEDRYFGLKAQPTEKLFEDMGENPDDYAMFNKFGIDHEDIKERIGYDVDFDEEHGLDYTNLITLNTHMVQKTRRELAELQKENAELKDMLKTIVKKINM